MTRKIAIIRGKHALPDGTRSAVDELRGSANVIFIIITDPMLVPAHRLGIAFDSASQIDGP